MTNEYFETQPNAEEPRRPVPPPVPRHRPKRSVWRIFTTVLLVLSILLNIVLIVMIIGMASMLTPAALSEQVVETVVIPGKPQQKIAAIHIDGIIDGRTSRWLKTQLEAAEKDPAVRGVILHISSPGGAVAASDRIHYEITRFKERTRKPVVAFMQSIAASGGYYAAVAGDTLIAEPMTITGSIGVIMNHMIIKDLLEEKLGISPVVIKQGDRKDWPSLFNEITEEQKHYLDERIILPAYERFVQAVYEGRRDILTESQVRELADGSIYTASDALDAQLIDAIGYFDQAVETVAQAANLTDPLVVEYRRKVSLRALFGAETGSSHRELVDTLLETLLVPQTLYLWDGRP